MMYNKNGKRTITVTTTGTIMFAVYVLKQSMALASCMNEEGRDHIQEANVESACQNKVCGVRRHEYR